MEFSGAQVQSTKKGAVKLFEVDTAFEYCFRRSISGGSTRELGRGRGLCLVFKDLKVNQLRDRKYQAMIRKALYILLKKLNFNSFVLSSILCKIHTVEVNSKLCDKLWAIISNLHLTQGPNKA